MRAEAGTRRPRTRTARATLATGTPTPATRGARSDPTAGARSDPAPAPRPRPPRARGRPEPREAARSSCFVAQPFRSPVEALMARQALARRDPPLPGAVRAELLVSGSILSVLLTAEEPAQLRVSVASFLEQLSAVVRALQRSGPRVVLKPRPEYGG